MVPPLVWFQMIAFYSFAGAARVRAEVDLAASLVYGPGVENANFHMPVRYFYVQLVDNNAQNYTGSSGDDLLTVKIQGTSVAGSSSNRCRVYHEIIARKDGSFIVRYRLFNTCSDLQIEVMSMSGEQVAQSPYILKGAPVLYPEECNCEPRDPDTWSSIVGCPRDPQRSFHQRRLYATWPQRTVNFSLVLAEAEKKYAAHPGVYSFCHYVIADNVLYRNCYGQHVGFHKFSDEFLLSIVRKVKLPNVEFLMNLGDWPLEKRKQYSSTSPIPILSWCGSEDTYDIVVPTYELTEATVQMMSGQSLDILSVQGMGPRWSEKIDKAFWRGRDSRQERLDAVLVSRKHPELLDAAITDFFFFTDVMDKYGPKVQRVSFAEFFKYKYVLSIDGTVAAYRLPFLLAGNSLVLKQHSPYFEFFYDGLKPWEHYVPVKADLSDLIEKIQWARNNEERVLKIIDNARNFAMQNLMLLNIYCYYVDTFVDFSKTLASDVKAPSLGKFLPVTQASDGVNCSCPYDHSLTRDKSEL